MKNLTGILCIGLTAMSASAQYNLQNISFSRNVFYDSISGNYKLEYPARQIEEEAKFTFRNLRLYMLKGNEQIRESAKDMGNYIPLKEALVKNKIAIAETSDGSVNALTFENTSQDTILILAGEIVTGGNQDRVVENDLLLLPNAGSVEVSVFCVEHGRWAPNGTGESFKGYFGVSTASVRKQAVVEKNQSGVWSQVAEVNRKSGINPSTGTYAAIDNADSLNGELNAYIKFFENLVSADSNYIGFVAVTGDTIISCDLFASNRLFQNHAGALLKSAAVEAVTNGAPVIITATRVLSFLSEFLGDDEDQEQKVNEKGTLLMNVDKKVHMNYYQTGKSKPSTVEPNNRQIFIER